MQFKIKVIPKSSENKIIELDNKSDSLDAVRFKIKVTDVPEKGKANSKVIQLLADYFGVAKSSVQIIRGLTISEKTIKIESSYESVNQGGNMGPIPVARSKKTRLFS
jgi:uncharacterized protein (TIGR00251 family)